VLRTTTFGGPDADGGSGQPESPGPTGADAIAVHVDLNRSIGPMYPMWAYIGYDEPNYTYLPDGRSLLEDFSELSSGPVYVRAHNMLTTHEGNPVALKWGSTDAYTEDEDGNPVYDWTTVDRIVDTWVELGMKPLMEIGFMPKALSTNPEPYRHTWEPGQPYSNVYTGWAYPPTDYDKWRDLVYEWVKHSVERYGAEEVETWWWQVWNEPNISYWQGTQEEFHKLHDYAADGLKRALPTARIGGPNTAGATGAAREFLIAFLEHCRSGTNYATGEVGSPLDFFGFHAKGSPRRVAEGGYVQMGMGNQLRQIDSGFEILASFPEFRDLPIILGESDPEGCAACPSNVYPEYDYRNGTVFSSYTASSFAKKYELADAHGINFEGATSWAFTFPEQPYFSGFRSLSTTAGINKPVLNVFRMYGMMGGDRVATMSEGNPYTALAVIENGVRAQPDVSALATIEENVASVMIWNYHDDNVYAPPAEIVLTVDGVPSPRRPRRTGPRPRSWSPPAAGRRPCRRARR
jgi:xylan 1,4-beta-xylosidase